MHVVNKGDNVHKILGAIGQMGENEGSDDSGEARFFVRYRTYFVNFRTTDIQQFGHNMWIDVLSKIFEIDFRKFSVCRQRPQNWRGQAGTLLWLVI